MRAWRLHGPGGRPERVDVGEPAPRPGGVVVRMEAAPVLSYMREFVAGTLGYAMPSLPFTPGTNGVGVVAAVGAKLTLPLRRR